MTTKTWLITGASSGIGYQLTHQILANGDKVIALVRRIDAMQPLQQQFADQLKVMYLDLTDVKQIDAIINTLFDSGSNIDYVVSNAAYGLFGAAEDLSDNQIEKQISTNLLGSIHLIRHTIRHLRKQGGGRIIQVSSEGGRVAYPGFSLYHATKWGIEGFVEAVKQEVEAFGIDFIIVEPGPTDTAFITAIDFAPTSPAYSDSIVAQLKAGLQSRSFNLKGDESKTAEAILNVASLTKPPFRVALGSIAFDNIKATLTQQLSELQEQKYIAYSADKIA